MKMSLAVLSALSAMFSVSAENDQWQPSGIVLHEDEVAMIVVPDLVKEGAAEAETQHWGIIDPKNRGERAYWGGEVEAGEKFVLPSQPDQVVKEGALLARLASTDKTSPIQFFTDVKRELYFEGPGEIQFIANDEINCKVGKLLFECRDYYKAKGSGFSDNVGRIHVKILVTKKQSSAQP